MRTMWYMVPAMLVSPAVDQLPRGQYRPSPRTILALFLSILLHVLLALAWLGFPLPEPKADQEQAQAVELVPEPPKTEKPKAQTPPPSPQPEPPALTKQVPQLQEGKLAEKSSPPQPQKAETPNPQPLAQPSLKPTKTAPVTQTERDFVLSQVLRHWRPPGELASYRNADVSVSVTVGADGYLTDMYDARRPWNPAEVFDGYGALAAGDLQRRTVDAFYQAIRQAQPLRLPDALRAKAPFKVRLDFRFRDVH